mgnify:CR=1 FL=1
MSVGRRHPRAPRGSLAPQPALAAAKREVRTGALPITVDAGTTATSGPETLAWQDDLADSATAGTCKTCHDSPDAIAHMQEKYKIYESHLNDGNATAIKATTAKQAIGTMKARDMSY